jgi:hypothetical protein
MQHFSFTDWADFTNGFSSPEQLAAMRLHLDAGCEKCKKLLRRSRSIRSLAQRTAEYEPPLRVIQEVKSAFVLQGPAKRRSRLAEVADLVFDSLNLALPVGVRSMEMQYATRKLLYRKGSLQIDLSVDRVSAATALHIDGQVLDSNVAGSVVPNVVVFLVSDKSKLTEGKTNALGEFHLECPARENLKLCIWLSANREIILPLEQYIKEVSRGTLSSSL